MAHRGEITIHVPWIVDKEFVSSIPEHVGELLNKEAGTRALARMTQASSNPTATRDATRGVIKDNKA